MRAIYIGSTAWRQGRGPYSYRGAAPEGGAPAPPPAPADPVVDFTATAEFTSSDWIQTRHDDATGTFNPGPVEPPPYSQYPLTTPLFATYWPYSGTTGDGALMNFEYRVKSGPGATQAITPAAVGRNYIILQTELTRGVEYEWRAQHPSLGWSDWRPFTIAADAVSMLVPTGNALYTAAAAKSHPRCVPSDFTERLAKYRAGGELRAYTTAAITNFDAYEGDALADEDDFTASQSPMGTIRTEFFRIVESWWLWKIENDTSYRDEGLRRLRGLIKPWDGSSGWLVTGGNSNYSSPGDDQAARSMLYACAVGFDLFYDELTTTEKQNAAIMSARRMQEYIQDTAQVGQWPMRNNWELSHPLNHVCVGGLAGLIFAGHEALTGLYDFSANVAIWARNADLPLQDFNGYVHHDGLHRHTWRYASFQWEYAILVDLLGNAASLDLWAQTRNGVQAEALYQLFPPEAASDWRRPFGDSSNNGFRYHMAHSYWLPRAGAYWSKVMSLAGQTTANIVATQAWHLLRSAPAAATGAVANNFPIYTDGGIFAWHSDQFDTERVSLWARASEGGGYNHAHCDHGHFVIAKGGRALFIHAGYFGEGTNDAFNGSSGYWDNYKQNWFRNTVTCDGTLGKQRFSASSDVINFRTRARFTRAYGDGDETYAYVVADLTKAYQATSYTHTQAVRVYVYLRPNVFLIFDIHTLTSGSYTWEWLFQTTNAPADGGDDITITNGAASCVLTPLYSNRALSSKTLTTTTPPGGVLAGGSTAAQYFNRLNYAAGGSFRACHMIDVADVTGGATPSAASCTTDANGMVATVTLNGVTYTVTVNDTTYAVSVVAS